MEVSGKILDAENVGSNHVCELCEYDNVTKQSDGFCKDCGEFMCNSCFQQHKRPKLCRNHVLVDINSLSTLTISERDDGDEAIKCRRHRGQIVRFYCRRHESVGCGDCMVFEHKTCDSEYIKDVSKNVKGSEGYKSLTTKVENLSSAIKTNEVQVKKERGNNKAMLTKALASARKFRQTVNKYLDEVENDIISEAKKILETNDNLLALMEETCQQVSSELKQIQEKIDVNVYKDTVLFVNTIECKSILADIEQHLAEVKPQNIKKYEFVADEQLRNMVSSKRKLGTLNVSSTEKKARRRVRVSSDTSSDEEPSSIVGQPARHEYWTTAEQQALNNLTYSRDSSEDAEMGLKVEQEHSSGWDMFARAGDRPDRYNDDERDDNKRRGLRRGRGVGNVIGPRRGGVEARRRVRVSSDTSSDEEPSSIVGQPARHEYWTTAEQQALNNLTYSRDSSEDAEMGLKVEQEHSSGWDMFARAGDRPDRYNDDERDDNKRRGLRRGRGVGNVIGPRRGWVEEHSSGWDRFARAGDRPDRYNDDERDDNKRRGLRRGRGVGNVIGPRQGRGGRRYRTATADFDDKWSSFDNGQWHVDK